MRFVVFGAGAIGSGLGGHLHRTGHDALIVGRPAHVNRIRQQGLQLVTDEQTYTLSVPAVARAEDVGFTDQDVVLLCVKSQDTDRAMVEIRAAGGDPQTLPILCCQNSITNEPAAARYFRRVFRSSRPKLLKTLAGATPPVGATARCAQPGLILAELATRSGLDRSRLSQRRDRAPGPPPRLPDALQRSLQEVANAMAARREKPGKFTVRDLENQAMSRAAPQAKGIR